ncbi:MAG: hypothetical protein ABIF22_03275 [bacterium]
MNNKLWFKAKTYGWGWYPCTWQGWLVILIWTIVFSSGLAIFKKYFTESEIIYYFIFVTISVLILLYICYKKGEKPGWRWDKDK